MSMPTIQMATAMRMVVGRLMRGDSGRMMALYLQRERDVQGDHSGCDKPPVDIKTKIQLILKRNFYFGAKRRFVTT